MSKPVVLAATGRLGRVLVARLLADGTQPIAVGRDPAKLAGLAGSFETRCADFDDPVALRSALADAECVICCGNAVHLPRILAALPGGGVRRFVAMGSTRYFSAIPDATAEASRDAERQLAASAVPSVLLLSSMIYGGGVGVVDGLAALAARFRILPVPAGTLVQPIHIDDVAAALASALTRPAAPGKPIVIAGPAAMPYAEMARRIVAARRLRSIVLPIPGWLLATIGSVSRNSSLRRLAEDAAFDVTPMRDRLGFSPRAFAP